MPTHWLNNDFFRYVYSIQWLKFILNSDSAFICGGCFNGLNSIILILLIKENEKKKSISIFLRHFLYSVLSSWTVHSSALFIKFPIQQRVLFQTFFCFFCKGNDGNVCYKANRLYVCVLVEYMSNAAILLKKEKEKKRKQASKSRFYFIKWFSCIYNAKCTNQRCSRFYSMTLYLSFVVYYYIRALNVSLYFIHFYVLSWRCVPIERIFLQ